MGLVGRICWNTAAYLFCLALYLMFSDGEGRYELVMRLVAFFGPAVILIDAYFFIRRRKK